MTNGHALPTSLPTRCVQTLAMALLPIAGLLLLAIPAGAQTIVLLADDFSLPSYSSGSINGADSSTNPDDQSASTFAAIGVGGNPGDAAVVFHEHRVARDESQLPLNGDGSTFLQSILVDQSSPWTPTTDGGLAALEFRLDVQLLPPNGSAGVDEVYFIVQDENGGSAAGFEPITPASGWQTIVVSGLVGADFPGRNLLGSLPLSFGFGFISSGDVTSEDETLAIDVDNFVVRAVPAPEPESTLLVAAGVGTMTALARRRASARRSR